METTIVYWAYIGLMENQMETTIYDSQWYQVGTMVNEMNQKVVLAWKAIGLIITQFTGSAFLSHASE